MNGALALSHLPDAGLCPQAQTSEGVHEWALVNVTIGGDIDRLGLAVDGLVVCTKCLRQFKAKGRLYAEALMYHWEEIGPWD